jgi:hypothetical protein
MEGVEDYWWREMCTAWRGRNGLVSLISFRFVCGSGACVALRPFRERQNTPSILGPSRHRPSLQIQGKQFRSFYKPAVPQHSVPLTLSLDAHDAKSTALVLLVCTDSLMSSQQQPEAEATPSPPNSNRGYLMAPQRTDR